MGQYYNNRKIGTCETMMYMRLEEAEQLAKCKAADDDGITFASMLTDNVTMFRFPFPDEDNVKGNLLSLPNHSPSFPLHLPPDFEINHSTVTISHGQPNVNYFIPCPHSPDCTIKHSPLSAPMINIMYQAMRDGEKATLYECSTCGQLQRCSREEMAEVVEYNRELFTQQHMPRKTPQWDDPDFVAKQEKELSNKRQILNRI